MKNFNLNLKKMVRLRGVPIALAATVLATSLTGCGKKAECSVEGDHAHLYTNEQGYEAYYNKEYLTYEGYERQEEYIPLTDEDLALYKFLDKKDLISLDDNLDVILAQQEQNQDYIEYRYSYKKRVTRMVGKVPTRRTVTRYSWTSDPNHSGLTGETRLCHYVYQACNVYKDEYGKYVVVPSEEVDDIRDLVGEYTYVRKIFYKVINLENNLELDYEDGPDDEELVNDEVITQSYNDN
ncbi:MAG: hypothetical protein K2H20_02770, partial [Bacilli bacterium]|nr:hypothetical protein [Bacilli bacterium]